MPALAALVIAEHDHASLKSATLHTVTAALQCHSEVHLLVAGSDAAGAANAAARIVGVTKVLHAEGASLDRKSTRLNSSHIQKSRMPSSA